MTVPTERPFFVFDWNMKMVFFMFLSPFTDDYEWIMKKIELKIAFFLIKKKTKVWKRCIHDRSYNGRQQAPAPLHKETKTRSTLFSSLEITQS